MRFWMSWYETQTDWRAVTDPPPDGIVGYWCSGIDNYSDDLIICGLVEADSEASAWEIVRGDDAFPGVRERFCKPGDDWKPTDRFALSDWMKARYERTEPKGQVMAKNETPATGQGDDMLVVHDPAEALKALATPEGVAALSLAAKDVAAKATGQGGHTPEPQYLVYSRACQMWWAPGGAGYRITEAEAGRFDKQKAEEYSRFPAWRAGQTPDGGPSEFMYLAPECAADPAATIRELREALRPVIDDVNKHTPSVFTDDNWNPTHQIEVGLTVGELKAIYAALRSAGGGA